MNRMKFDEQSVADRVEAVLASHRMPERVEVRAAGAGYVAVTPAAPIPPTVQKEISLATGAAAVNLVTAPQGTAMVLTGVPPIR